MSELPPRKNFLNPLDDSSTILKNNVEKLNRRATLLQKIDDDQRQSGDQSPTTKLADVYYLLAQIGENTNVAVLTRRRWSVNIDVSVHHEEVLIMITFDSRHTTFITESGSYVINCERYNITREFWLDVEELKVEAETGGLTPINGFNVCQYLLDLRDIYNETQISLHSNVLKFIHEYPFVVTPQLLQLYKEDQKDAFKRAQQLQNVAQVPATSPIDEPATNDSSDWDEN